MNCEGINVVREEIYREEAERRKAIEETPLFVRKMERSNFGPKIDFATGRAAMLIHADVYTMRYM